MIDVVAFIVWFMSFVWNLATKSARSPNLLNFSDESENIQLKS